MDDAAPSFPSLRDRVDDVVASWYADEGGDLASLTLDHALLLVQAAAVAQEESGFVLQRWVSAARRSGASWEQLGTALGVSKQAAQQRFVEAEPTATDPAATAEHVRRNVTAFNEVEVLREEGRNGAEVVRAGWGKLVFRDVGRPTENLRIVSLRPGRTIAEMESGGWRHAFSWYPYTYFSRPAAAAGE